MNETLNADVIVLGAGIVGVSTALQLQRRGRRVAVVDRRGVAEETSYGNTGIIQREGVVPYPFPRDIGRLAQYALNMRPESNLHWSALPKIAPWLYSYFRASTDAGLAATARAAKPLIERCLSEHEMLLTEAGLAGMMRRTGYLRYYRTAHALAAQIIKDESDRRAYGVNYRTLDARTVAEIEPHLAPCAGGVLMPDPVSVGDPSAVGKGYARLLEERGGRVLKGDARTLQALRGGWQVRTAEGPVSAREVVVALGPWSDDMFQMLGLKMPFGVKRGYHLHFKPEGNATLNRPVLDAEVGYAMTPMVKGIRLTTGAEFAWRDAPPTPVQLKRVEPRAREVFPLGTRIDAEPWLGRRPCLPDMLPVVGRAPAREGIWLNFGHHHLGFTLGPVTGRLLAEQMTGEKPFTDPTPYQADRFQ